MVRECGWGGGSKRLYIRADSDPDEVVDNSGKGKGKKKGEGGVRGVEEWRGVEDGLRIEV